MFYTLFVLFLYNRCHVLKLNFVTNLQLEIRYRLHLIGVSSACGRQMGLLPSRLYEPALLSCRLLLNEVGTGGVRLFQTNLEDGHEMASRGQSSKGQPSTILTKIKKEPVDLDIKVSYFEKLFITTFFFNLVFMKSPVM